MKGWHKVAVFGLGLIAVNAMTAFVTERNLRSGVYPADADSIGIPIISTLVASLIVAPFLYQIAILYRANFFHRLRKKGAVWCTLCLALLYLPAMAFAILGAGYWMEPDHYLISLCFGALIFFLALSLLIDLRHSSSDTVLDPRQQMDAEKPPG